MLMTTLFYKVGGLGVGVHPQLCPPPPHPLESTPAPSVAVLFVALEPYGKNILDNTKHNITQLEETHFLYLLALFYVYIVVQENINILFPPYKGSLEI